MKTYLVTGGAGFIGSNFILYMLKKYINKEIRIINFDKLTYAGNLENLNSVENDSRYTFIHGDVCDKELLEQVFDEHQINYIVNFAAESHVDRSIEDPDVFLKTNVIGTVNLLNVAKDKWQQGDGVYKYDCRFIQISTDEVYGSLGETGYFTETSVLDPHSPYSAAKTSADHFVKAYFDTYKLPVNITRCSNNYGPYQFPEKLIPLMINNALQHKELPVYGDGLNVRDWLYVEDHCKAIDMVISQGNIGEVYNIGGENEKTNIDIVRTIISHLQKLSDSTIDERLIKYVADRKGHDKRYAIDPSKIRSSLGWFSETDFSVGIERTIKWYLENKTWMKNIVEGEYQDYYKKMYL